MNKSQKNILNELNDSFLNENKIIFKKYKPIKIIGKGAFGRIYSTIRLEDKSVFAMKTEIKNPLRKLLENEAFSLFNLKGLGIPDLISFGHTKKYNILIETLLDKSLYELFIKSKKPCDLINTCLIAIQLIERLEWIHSKNIVYRDVKPENFMIGLKDPNIIYVVDFGLCKKYRSSKTGKHILPMFTKKFNGTLKYASNSVVRGKESSRKDDLISLGYVLIFLYKRNLPWNNKFSDLTVNQYLNVIYTKETNDNGKLFNDLPQEIIDFMKYTQRLKFEEDPNYTLMKQYFINILTRMNLNIYKLNFIWINPDNNNMKAIKRKNFSRREKRNSRLIISLDGRRTNRDMIDSKNVSNEKNNILNHKHFLNYSSFQNINSNILEDKNKIENKKINNKNNNYKQMIKNTSRIKKQIYRRKNLKSILQNNNPVRNNYNINTNNNIYINNNNNFIVNLENIDNKKMGINKIKHRKINSLIDYNNGYKKDYNINKFTNFNNNYSFNLNNNFNTNKISYIHSHSNSIGQINSNNYINNLAMDIKQRYNYTEGNNSRILKQQNTSGIIFPSNENQSGIKMNNNKISRMKKIPRPTNLNINYYKNIKQSYIGGILMKNKNNKQ